jgi:uncharacterized repeat protein (TIGR03809 family)
MAHRPGVAGGHELVARWCALAEQRLEYLTEMFESGRWRRYHSERAFLENIKEAKVAVETWRGLSTPGLIHGQSAVALSVLEPKQAPRRDRIERQAAPFPPKPVGIAAVAPVELAPSGEVASEPAIDMFALERVLDVPQTPLDLAAIEQRYPLLRNTL